VGISRKGFPHKLWGSAEKVFPTNCGDQQTKDAKSRIAGKFFDKEGGWKQKKGIRRRRQRERTMN